MTRRRLDLIQRVLDHALITITAPTLLVGLSLHWTQL